MSIQINQILKIYKKEYHLSSSDRNDGTNGGFYYLMLILNPFDHSNDDICCNFLYSYYFLYEGEKLFVQVYITSHDRAYLSTLFHESKHITPPFLWDMIRNCSTILDAQYTGNKSKPWEDARELMNLAISICD